MRHVARSDELESLDIEASAGGGRVRYFRGEQFGVELSLLRSTVIPGQGAPLHTHAYDEVFVVHRGRGRYTVEDESVEATEGDIVVVPAGLRHAYVSVGPEALQQTSVHRSAVFAQTLVAAPDVEGHNDR